LSACDETIEQTLASIASAAPIKCQDQRPVRVYLLQIQPIKYQPVRVLMEHLNIFIFPLFLNVDRSLSYFYIKE
jgi:hypothetical protein